MKNWSIFAVSSPKTTLASLGVEIFISTVIGRRTSGLPIPNDFCTERSEIVFGEMGIARPFFRALYFNFLFMPKTTKNCGTVNYSTRTSTSAHDTSKSLHSKFLIEKNAKNKAYAFILSSGLLSEFTEFSRAYSGECQSTSSRLELTLKNC